MGEIGLMAVETGRMPDSLAPMGRFTGVNPGGGASAWCPTSAVGETAFSDVSLFDGEVESSFLEMPPPITLLRRVFHKGLPLSPLRGGGGTGVAAVGGAGGGDCALLFLLLGGVAGAAGAADVGVGGGGE